MGHKRLGYLPKTKAWREIVKLIGEYAAGSADITSIANKTLQKVQARFENLSNDPSIHSSFEFLVQVSYAFQKENPLKYLTEKKILEKEELSVIKLARAGANYKKEEAVNSHEYQVFAKQAVIDTINNWYSTKVDAGQNLFSESIDSVAIFSKAANGSGFCELSRMYFAKLTERYLKYFLDREAASKIPNIHERERFSKEIENHIGDISQHAFDTSKIAQSFSAGWFNKFAKEDFPKERQINKFLSFAFGKMKGELIREELK